MTTTLKVEPRELSVPAFIPLNELTPANALIELVYGPSGTGKTFHIGSAGPRLLYIYFLNEKETLLSPRFHEKVASKWPAGEYPITVSITEKVNPATGWIDAATAFDAVSDTIDYALKHFPDKFDTVAIDGATNLRRVGMNKAIELSKVSRNSPTLDRVKSKVYDGIVIPEPNDYQMEMKLIEWFCITYADILRNVGKNFILSAHERCTYSKPQKIGGEKSLIRVRPGFTGETFPDDIQEIFDEVWHSEVSMPGPVYRLRMQGDEVTVAKTRHGGTFKEVLTLDTNFNSIVNEIKSKYAQLKR